MSYPTKEDQILDHDRLSEWLERQIVETRELDIYQMMEDIDKLRAILEKRMDRHVKEKKSFKTQVNLNAIDF